MNFRTWALAFAGCATAFPAFAAPPPSPIAPQDVLEAIGRCAAITDNTARLSCYDALTPRVKDALAAPPEALPGNRTPTAEEERSWFGFDLSSLFGASPSQQTTPAQFGSDRLPSVHAQEQTAAAEVDTITAGVTEVSFTPFGRFIVFLDNGQVWRQIEGDTDLATFSFRKPAKDNKVMISRGLIGSYNLSINDSNRTFKVTRVK
jgi:hypothetical protein